MILSGHIAVKNGGGGGGASIRSRASNRINMISS